jgi:hypothetical protein
MPARQQYKSPQERQADVADLRKQKLHLAIFKNIGAFVILAMNISLGT